MDPNHTWKCLIAAIDTKRFGYAYDLAGDLLDWLNKDGFPPSITKVVELDRRIAKYVCIEVHRGLDHPLFK